MTENQGAPAMPAHIAIIMDGNGRWAIQRGLPRKMGHKQGAKCVETIARYCRDIGVGALTLFAFSTENWKRPKDEIDAIMDLLRGYLKEAEKQANENVRTVILGDCSFFDDDLRGTIERLQRESAHCTGLTLNIAINYGGREELTRAVRILTEQAAAGALDPKAIDEQAVSSCLYTAGQPDPDLIIRPSGEKRLSNFLLWQCAYAEFVFMDVLWPDFTPAHLDAAIAEYQARSRRFGGI